MTTLDLRVIERVLEMGGGYVLDFSDRTFADFFREHGIDIDDPHFSSKGSSKGKRMREFLLGARPELAAAVLSDLLEHRLAWRSEGITPADEAGYQRIVRRLSGGVLGGSAVEQTRGPETDEAALLRLVLRPELFRELPVEAELGDMLLHRVREAEKCLGVDAYLAAVILCGSVLEGMCLGWGKRWPERANRAYSGKYQQAPPAFAEWKLRQWIDVLGYAGVLSPNIEQFGHALRDFRNYVHPAQQLSNRFSPDSHTARISFQVVIAAAEDLVRAAARNDGEREA